jgi:hypothetical protein
MMAPAGSGADERSPTTPLQEAIGASPPAVSPPAYSLSAAGTPMAVTATASTTGPTTAPTKAPAVVSLLPLYTPADAAELLAVRESWLRRRATARMVPCTFLGKHLRFSHADIVAIATAGSRSAGAATPRFRGDGRRAGRTGRR